VGLRRATLIGLEVSLVFIVNLFVSWIRFDMDLEAVLFEYPAIPKIFIYPVFWYLSISLVHGWDRSIVVFGNELFTRVLSAAWRTLVIFATFAYLIKFPISRLWIFANIAATTIAILLIRLAVRTWINRDARSFDALHYIYVGEESSMGQSLDEFRSNFGFIPKVIVIEPPKTDDQDEWLDNYIKSVKKESVSGVIVGYHQIGSASVLKELADVQRDKVIDFILISRISPLVSRFEVLDNPTLVRVRESSIVGSASVLKRIFDFFFAALALVIFSPLLLITAILVKITSKGPVLYVDKRVGKNGSSFLFPKFRSMYQGSDRQRLELLGRPDEEMLERYKTDPRVTPFGRFIRRWSIDELPQLWCVLIGTMSTVGPRPILHEELSQIGTEFESRFIAKPGLTGLWQVTGRKEVSWSDRMLRDVAYIDQWSFSKDLILILKTIRAIVSGHGAM
jgi:exopolysaccharide biosynthesis polyprenyl glycosylphosphotransferase